MHVINGLASSCMAIYRMRSDTVFMYSPAPVPAQPNDLCSIVATHGRVYCHRSGMEHPLEAAEEDFSKSPFSMVHRDGGRAEQTTSLRVLHKSKSVSEFAVTE